MVVRNWKTSHRLSPDCQKKFHVDKQVCLITSVLRSLRRGLHVADAGHGIKAALRWVNEKVALMALYR